MIDMMKKKIAILGSTGSIGCQTLEVIDRFPEKFEVVSLAAGFSLEKLARQVHKYRPRIVSIGSAADLTVFRDMIPGDTVVAAGVEGMTEAAVMEQVDTVVTSVTGTLGLIPTIEAIKAGKDIAIANKETLVAAGELVMSLAGQKGVRLLPVDSEHSAIFQCLNGEHRVHVNKLILTASGGPFLNKTKEELLTVGIADALNHPNWSMGRKITVDSASMMNKGLEVIEAHWLFGIDFSSIEVLIHPQSLIHSMVEFTDGSVIAQMGVPDMRIPIQYALSYPSRWENEFPRLDLAAAGMLTFEKPRTDVFPSLELAYHAGKRGGTLPAVMNAANESAVSIFLAGRIRFADIPALVEKVMVSHICKEHPGLAEILDSDSWAREEMQRLTPAQGRCQNV